MDSIRNEGKDAFEINSQSGEVFTKQVFDREKKGAYALEVEARDGAPSARPNSGGRPNTGRRSTNKDTNCSQTQSVDINKIYILKITQPLTGTTTENNELQDKTSSLFQIEQKIHIPAVARDILKHTIV